MSVVNYFDFNLVMFHSNRGSVEQVEILQLLVCACVIIKESKYGCSSVMKQEWMYQRQKGPEMISVRCIFAGLFRHSEEVAAL